MDLAKYRRLFVDESREHLALLNRELLRLEGEGGGVEALFRAVHSVKGMGGSLGYDAIVDVAHALEDVLDALRGKSLVATPGLVQVLFEGVDALAGLVAEVEEYGMPRGSAAEITARLRGALAAAPCGGAATGRPKEIVGLAARRTGQRSTTVSVDARALDDLSRVASELIAAQERLESIGSRVGSPELDSALGTLRPLMLSLQDAVAGARTMPLAVLTDRLPRLVRDIARSSGKEVSFAVEGEGIAVDRAILEQLDDVLIHLVRNALDHGVESPGERTAAGKERKAAVRLRAGQDRDWFWISVEDDGRGMDPERIAAAAVERGLATSAAVAAMGEAEKLMLCCLPGVSTAESVTGISGRGVGMDAVRDRIDAGGGTLRIESRPGRGTAIVVRLPLRYFLPRP